MDASTPGARPPSPDALQIPLWLMAIDPPCVRWRNAAAERLPPLELPEAARLGAWYRDCLDRGPQMLDWPYAGGPARVRIAALNEAEGGPALLVEGLVAPAAARLARTLLAFGHATVPLSVFDGDGWLLAHSPAARAHFGSGAGNLYELFMRAQDRADCQTALIHGEVWINELPLRTVDGERWHEVRVTRRDDPVEGGELLLFEARDIETLRSLRLRLDPLLDTEHALFERSGIGLALLRRGRIVRASRRLGALL
ncbi:MAG TPA: PAS domain-containing protein, partial [Plasticicumulans sp.]|nr:PAS domain-containing protein [Plasticicumulans sp.]